MGFKVLVDTGDGSPFQVVHEIEDKRVTRVSISTTNGEGGAVHISPDQTEVLLRFDTAIQDGRPNLVDVESHRTRTLTGDEAQERIDDLAELPSATNQGGDPILTASERQFEEDQAVEAAIQAARDQSAEAEVIEEEPETPPATTESTATDSSTVPSFGQGTTEQ